MIKQGRLAEPYKGVVDCVQKTLKSEGVIPFWRGNLANVLRYFPTQALNFAFKDTIKALFKVQKDAPQYVKFGTNILSGGMAGSLSLALVYSLDFARTRLANDAKGKGGERQFNGLICKPHPTTYQQQPQQRQHQVRHGQEKLKATGAT